MNSHKSILPAEACLAKGNRPLISSTNTQRKFVFNLDVQVLAEKQAKRLNE